MPLANIHLYSQTDGFRAILQHATDFLAIVGLGFAAFTFAMEFSSGTVRIVRVRQSNRLHLFGGKGAVVGALPVAMVVLAYVVAFRGADHRRHSRNLPLVAPPYHRSCGGAGSRSAPVASPDIHVVALFPGSTDTPMTGG